MITRAQALEIAREECARRGWPWNEPLSVKWGFIYYTIWGGGRKGGNLSMKIRKKTGEIVRVEMTPL